MKAGQCRSWLLAAAIIFLTLLAYQPIWHAGFVWDDDFYVTENQALRSADGLQKIWSTPGATIQYYPLVFTSFWAEYHFWKLQPLGYHLVNVLLHALNAVLLWRVLRRLLRTWRGSCGVRGLSGAWLAAAIFALHPVMVESAAWITERKNVLSCLFYLLAALAFLRFRPLTDDKATRAWDWRFYPVMLAAFLCALLSKTVTCSLPAALLLVIWWKTGRIEKRDALAMVPLFVLGAVLALVTLNMEKHAGAVGLEWTLSFAQRCLIAGRALWFYAGKLFWPRDLTFIYPRWKIDAVAGWQYSFPLAALAVVVALWKLRTRIGRGPLVAALFFAGTLAPALGFFDLYPFRYSYVADHFQYVAGIGLIALTVNASAMMVRRIGGHTRSIAIAAGVALLLALGSATWTQAHVYRDLEMLWRDTLAKNPGCWMAHNNLSVILIEEGRMDEALRHSEQALQLKSDDPDIYGSLGTALWQSGKIPEAIQRYEQALRSTPNSAGAHINLGNALLTSGQMPEAIRHFEQALRIQPDSAMAHNNLGIALMQIGRVQEAIGHYVQAIRIEPDYAEAHADLGNALFQLGKVPEAITEYERALQLKPKDANAHYRLALALEQAHRVREAIGHYEQALRMKPDRPEVQNNLAWLLATIPPADGGDPSRAVILAQRACQLTDNRVVQYLDTLAVAYAAVGQFDRAVTTTESAVALARSNGQTQLLGELNGRLELFRHGHAYRESTNAPASGRR